MRRGERGQAMTETLLLLWMLMLFIATAYQVFIVHETIFRSLATVHQLLFRETFANNCANKGTARCRYTSDIRNRVIWRSEDVPEIEIPIVGMFERYGLASPMRLTSNSPLHADTYKRTKLAAGTYYPIWRCVTGSCLSAGP